MLSETESKPGFVIPSGSSSLDRLLGGGVYSGEVTEIFGAFTTGKSQVAMSLTLQAVLLPFTLTDSTQPQLGRAWYLDSSSNFSASRLAEMFEHRMSSKDKAMGNAERMEATVQVLERVQVFDVRNAFQLLNVLSQLNTLLYESVNQIPNTNPQVVPPGTLPEVLGLKLVVVDALGVLFAPLVSIKHKFGRSLLLEIAQLMKSIATTYNIAFVVVNHAAADWNSNPHEQIAQLSSNEDMNYRGSANPNGATGHLPALGKHWSYVPSVQLFLRYPTQDSILMAGGRVAELRKSTHAPTGPKTRTNFTLSNKGADAPLG